jgi:hypothetical protein
METPAGVAAALPPEWRHRVLFENAASAYGGRVGPPVATG